jgi:hypothetical protein
MIKNHIESLDETKSKPLNLEDYLNTYDTCEYSLAADIEDDLALACFDWNRLTVNHEYEIRWHLTSVFDAITDENGNPAKHYDLLNQPFCESSTQTDSIYNNLVRLTASDAKKLILKSSPYVTLNEGLTIRPFGEYFSICHKQKQNKRYDARVKLSDLKLINFKPLEQVKSDKNIDEGLKTQAKTKAKSVSSSTKIICCFLTEKPKGSLVEFFEWSKKLEDCPINGADGCEIIEVKHSEYITFADRNAKKTTLSRKSLSSSISRNRLK